MGGGGGRGTSRGAIKREIQIAHWNVWRAASAAAITFFAQSYSFDASASGSAPDRDLANAEKRLNMQWKGSIWERLDHPTYTTGSMGGRASP